MQTHTIDLVDQDLIVEVHKTKEYDPVLIKIRTKGLESSAVVLWLEDVEALQDAIEDAYCIGLGWERGIGTDNGA